jgi:putative transposase
LIRSLGGWAEVKEIRLKGQDRLKGDQRILGDSDFVLGVLSEADEQYERRYRLKKMGYTLERIEEKVIDLFEITKEDLYSRSREKVRSDSRSLLCYWAVRELGMNGTELAKPLGLSQTGVVYAVKRAKELQQRKAGRY